MKVLMLTDGEGNGDGCSLLLPDQMSHWKVGAFRTFLATGSEGATDEGFLARAPEPLRFEPFRQLAVSPELTFNRPVTFAQHDRPLRDEDSIDLTEPLNCVTIGRDPTGSDPDATLVSVAARNRQAFASCGDELVGHIDQLFDFATHSIMSVDGEAITSFRQLVGDFEAMLDTANKLRFLCRIARVIHAAPFENFSKVIAGRQFRGGYEMWGNMAQGLGGVCGEKSAALKFVCDLLSIPNRPVLGSDDVIPDDFEDSLRAYVDSGGSEELPVDIHHHILELTVDSAPYLVDVTNGNIPMVFLDSDGAAALVRGGYRARMVYRVDRMTMRRCSAWTGDMIETLAEYHVPELHLQYVFKQGLGLQISPQAYIGVYFDWGGEASALKQNYYSSRARKLRFPYPRFIHADNLASVPDPHLRTLLDRTRKALRHHYPDKTFTGDFTFVIQPLAPHFWTLPRVSESVKRLCLEENC